MARRESICRTLLFHFPISDQVEGFVERLAKLSDVVLSQTSNTFVTSRVFLNDLPDPQQRA